MQLDYETVSRFADKIAFSEDVDFGGCWNWEAAVGSHGYGAFMLCANGKRDLRLAHRFSYELARGLIPDGLHLDHLCRNRICVNPAHLEPVTSAVNTKRGLFGAIIGAYNSIKTHCPRGHEYAGDNLKLERNGARSCRACNVLKYRRYRARKRALTEKTNAAA